MSDDRPNPRLRHAFLPALIFVVIAAATVAAAMTLWRSGESRDAARFELEARVTRVAVSERIERQVALLRGAAGMFAADPDVDGFELDAYVDRLNLSTRYPGTLGIGYARRVDGAAARDALVAAMRANAASSFRVFPAGDRAVYFPVVLLSPLDRRNRTAIGFDSFSGSTRREAMILARDSGSPVTTGRVLLVQDADAERQPGFLIYVPVYSGGRVPVTPHARAERLDGFVYSPLRARDLLETVFPADEVRSVAIAIYDRAAAPGNLLYETGPLRRDQARFYEEIALDVPGRQWVLAIATRDAFNQGSQRSLAWWAAALGVLAAAVLAYAALAQGRLALAAERARGDLRRLNETLETRVEERTAEVVATYASMRGEVERRQGAEEQVRQMQKMEAVGQLTGGIAHDFNNMLAIVIGSLDMAKRRIADPDRVARLLDNAMEGATRAATLTQRLLAFSRRQPLKPEAVDINALVAGMTELLRRTLGETIRLETALGDGVGLAFVDVSQLENAILNLAVNARDAMPGGGALTISTEPRALDAAYAEAHPTVTVGDYTLIAVVDTGEGMPADVVARAFDPFFTTKEVGKGTGLGLSQVLGFIQQSGGHVDIASAPGTGTTISIFLPVHAGATIASAAARASDGGRVPRGSSGEIVLVVEDEDQVRLMSVEALRDLGYTVIHADGGAEAMRMLARYPGIRLLFTDVVMPGMNGRELADRAAALSPDLKLLFTTGYAQDAVVVNGRVQEGVDLIPKPFTFEQLAFKVREVLDA